MGGVEPTPPSESRSLGFNARRRRTVTQVRFAQWRLTDQIRGRATCARRARAHVTPDFDS